MSTQGLEAAIAVGRNVLANVKADQMGDATPCKAWKVSDLINHMVGAHIFFRAGVDGSAPEGIEAPFADGDYVSAYDTEAGKALAAFQGEGVMQKMLTLPFGTMPGAAFIGLAMTDTFTHAWDLAKATGQSTDLDPQLATMLLAASKESIQPAFRSEEGSVFGPERSAPAGCTKADELAAFLGREV